MPVRDVTHIATSSTSATGVTANRPTTVDNDVLVAIVGTRSGTGQTFTPPDGWTLWRRQDRTTTIALAAYIKVASSEPATYNWGWSAAGQSVVTILSCYDIDTSDPTDADGGQANGAGLTAEAPSITTAVNGALLIFAAQVNAATSFTPPSGMTEQTDLASSGGSNVTQQVATETQATAGVTGTRTATIAASEPSATLLLALKPVVAGGGTFTGSGTPDLPALSASGAGTHTAPVYEGAGAAALPAIVGAGTGSHTAPIYTGSGAADLPALAGAGAGTHEAPVYVGAGALPLPAYSGSGAGSFTIADVFTGTGAAELPALAASGAGTHTAPIYTGSGAATLGSVAAAGVGLFAPPAYSGAGAAALPALAGGGVGSFVPGADVILPPVTVHARRRTRTLGGAERPAVLTGARRSRTLSARRD